MMQPNSNFRLSKSTKRMIAAEADPIKANHIKRNMIQAELSAAIQPRRERNRKNNAE